MEIPTETRYQRALKRNLHEVGRAILERKAMIGIKKADTYHTVDFIKIAYDALYNDMIAHAIKVFEDRGDASFWYIKRCKKKEIHNFVKENNIDISRFKVLTKSLKHIRDKTHFHIDRNAVKNTKQVWKDAGIKGRELAKGLDDLWSILNYLYKLEFDEDFVFPEYDGSDATEIAKFAENRNSNLEQLTPPDLCKCQKDK